MNYQIWPVAVLVSLVFSIHAPAMASDAQLSLESPASEEVEEIVVRGERRLSTIRADVRNARERVYDLFNSLASDDEFRITCTNHAQTGTRIPQRVCRPQFADNATGRAAYDVLMSMYWNCSSGFGAPSAADLFNECMNPGLSQAQAAHSEIHLKDQLLADEFRRLVRENPDFRRAITEYMVVERQYEQARRGADASFEATITIVDTTGAPSRRGSRQALPAPRPVELVQARLPWSSSTASSTGEGWVRLHYTVQGVGSTANVRAVDMSPPGLDPSTAIEAVESWRFEPAVSDGAPVDWHYNVAVITFRRGDAGHAAWPEFVETYEAIAELIADMRYEEARTANETMLTELAFTLEEISLVQMQRAAIEHALGNLTAALTAIRHATVPEVQSLGNQELRVALAHRFALELELGRAADALNTFERRAALGRVSARDPLARQAAALREALAAPDTSLTIQARIGDRGRWNHVLHWNTFAIGDVQGEAAGLLVECHRSKAELAFEEDIEITIPSSWGRCALSVTGQSGTTFTLYEFQQAIDEL